MQEEGAGQALAHQAALHVGEHLEQRIHLPIGHESRQCLPIQAPIRPGERGMYRALRGLGAGGISMMAHRREVI